MVAKTVFFINAKYGHQGVGRGLGHTHRGGVTVILNHSENVVTLTLTLTLA